MRRAVANSVVLVLLSIFFAPAIAASAPNPVALCCRRGGAHHCTAMAAMVSTDRTCFRTDNPCPMGQGPQLGSSVVALPGSLTSQVGISGRWLLGRAALSSHFAPLRAEHQRGPPIFRG